jgi:uncharacterized membrane protein
MDALGPYHPQIVHTPVALLFFSAFFAILGRLFDRDWLRKASVLMLVFGFLGAFLAVNSGQATHEIPEHKQGVPEREIDEHAEMGRYTLYLAGGALLALGIAARTSGSVAGALGVLALLLQLGAMVTVGIAGKRGGDLVYQYGANVRVGGNLVQNTRAAAEPAASTGARDEDEKHEGAEEAGEKH